MIDSGAQPNVIRISALRGDLLCYEENAPILRGVAGNAITSYGTVHVRLFGKPTEFVVVSDYVLTHTQIILGSQFFNERGAIIDYTSNTLAFEGHFVPFLNRSFRRIPPRTAQRHLCKINSGKTLDLDYVKSIDLGVENTEAGSEFLSNENGFVRLRIVNHNDHSVEITLPVVDLLPIPSNFERHAALDNADVDNIIQNPHILGDSQLQSSHKENTIKSLGKSSLLQNLLDKLISLDLPQRAISRPSSQSSLEMNDSRIDWESSKPQREHPLTPSECRLETSLAVEPCSSMASSTSANRVVDATPSISARSSSIFLDVNQVNTQKFDYRDNGLTDNLYIHCIQKRLNYLNLSGFREICQLTDTGSVVEVFTVNNLSSNIFNKSNT